MRLAYFLELLARVPRPLRLLDVGGTESFWTTLAPQVAEDRGLSIVLLNLRAEPTRLPNVMSVAGDARDMGGFEDGSFDVVFSNSVIEHLGGFEAQRQMAREVRRLGRRYFVQTPNFWFPLEPHYLVPGFQLLPVAVRAELIRRFDLGWIPRQPDPVAARRAAWSIQLLTARKLRRLFPGATLIPERVLGLTKAWLVHAGF